MRLIDADALPEMEIERFDTTDSFEVKAKGAGRNHMRKIIEEAPTIDAVPVRYVEWISVNEKLPDNQRPVLVYVPESEDFCEYVGMADYTWSPKGGFWCGTDGETYGAIGFIRTPTHWCELPEPPKGEKND